MRAGRSARAAVGGALVASVVAGGALLGGGSAAAASPILVGSCGAGISGQPGQPITLSGAALVEPVTNVVKALPLVGTALASLVSGIVAPLQIPLGVVPSASRTIPGSEVAASTSTALQGTALAPQLGPITAALTTGCSVVVTVVNSTGAALQGATAAVGGAVAGATTALPQLPAIGGSAPAPAAPPAAGGTPSPGGSASPGGGTAAAGGSTAGTAPTFAGTVSRAQSGDLLAQVTSGTATQYSFGRVPLYSYAGTPFTAAGGAGRGAAPASFYGSTVPGYAPQFGILGDDAAAGSGDGVADASQVEALGLSSTPGTVGVVTLLAVLLLSGTSAAVVRTLVLRRTGPVAA